MHLPMYTSLDTFLRALSLQGGETSLVQTGLGSNGSSGAKEDRRVLMQYCCSVEKRKWLSSRGKGVRRRWISGQEKVDFRVRNPMQKATWREGSRRHKAGRENLLAVHFSRQSARLEDKPRVSQ